MNTYYVSLAQFLRGYYIQVTAEDRSIVYQWANKRLPRLWYSVYKPEEEIENAPHFDKSKVIGPVHLRVEDGEIYYDY